MWATGNLAAYLTPLNCLSFTAAAHSGLRQSVLAHQMARGPRLAGTCGRPGSRQEAVVYSRTAGWVVMHATARSGLIFSPLIY
jgi:hypothetical protein